MTSKDNKLGELFCNSRIQQSSISRTVKIDDFYSDRSRIVFSSSFRRLQQKAQVFSLEPNASVRTRMTHSLEVADIGRTLASKIADDLFRNDLLTVEDIPILVAIVENACLLHDIGNPPFGHFGETAIKDWAKKSLADVAKCNKINTETQIYTRLTSDFREFDGNPQGFRIITKLHTERDEFSLNLTYATLLSAIKYARASNEEKDTGICKKAGYFQSEKAIVEKMHKDIKRERRSRYPLTYIMEAADDISYCLSDISDGLEKRIITVEEFKKEFEKIWQERYGDDICPITFANNLDSKNFNVCFAVPCSRKVVEEATKAFVENYESFYQGTAKQLISETGMGRVLETIKDVSRAILYTSIEAESIELTGHAVVTGVLEYYQQLLELPYDKFELLLKGEKNELDYERRLFNRIGKRYINSYKYTCAAHMASKNFKMIEWWARVHLIIDHVSGMTDEFALNTYQMLKGIKLLPL